MKLKTSALAVLLIVVLFGGIFLSQQLGWWNTESAGTGSGGEKTAVTIPSGTYAGTADPADIRGSYTFTDISKNFNIPIEDLADAFLVMPSEAAVIKCKDIETMASAGKYGDLEVGTSSVRAFVANYLGMEIAAATPEDDIPPSAIKVILERGKPTAAQKAMLEEMLG